MGRRLADVLNADGVKLIMVAGSPPEVRRDGGGDAMPDGVELVGDAGDAVVTATGDHAFWDPSVAKWFNVLDSGVPDY